MINEDDPFDLLEESDERIKDVLRFDYLERQSRILAVALKNTNKVLRMVLSELSEVKNEL